MHIVDKGEGKELSLSECPRAKLESELIHYCTPQQRKQYKVRGFICYVIFNSKGIYESNI